MSFDEKLEIKKYKLLRKERVKKARRKRALYTVIIVGLMIVQIIALI